MDELTFVDMERWDRADFYRQFTEVWPSIYGSATKKLDITGTVRLCREKGIKLVPVFLYCTARAINEQRCLKYWMRDKKLCYWNVLHPMYTLNNDNGTLSYHATKFDKSFKAFYESYMTQRKNNGSHNGLFAGNLPENVFSVSILPNFDFESVSFSMGASKRRFMPVCVVGKFSGEEKILLPVSLTINHAVVNGAEVGLFFNTLQSYYENPQEWIYL